MHHATPSDRPAREATCRIVVQRASLRAVGEALDVSEDAAQKRVERALERLRNLLAGQGVNCSTAALVTVMSGITIQAAPAGLAATLASAALINASGMPIASTTLAMIMSKTKIAIAGAAVLGASTTLVVQHHSLHSLRSEHDALQGQLTEATAQPDAEGNAALRDELARLRGDLAELHKLRGEVALLRRENAELRSQPSDAPEDSATETPVSPSDNPPGQQAERAEPFRTRIIARLNYGESLVTGGWETEPGRRLVVFLRPSLRQSDEGQEEIALQPLGVDLPESLLAKYGLDALMTDSRRTSQNGLIFPGADVESIMYQLAKEPGTRPVVLPEQPQRPGKSLSQFAKGRDGAVVYSQSTVDLAPDGTGFDLDFDWAVPADAIHHSAP